MHFFFDESGDFSLPRSPHDHRAAVVAAIAIPDHVAPELQKRFRDFVSTLEPNERVKGEPKGSRLCFRHRKQFADMLARFRFRLAFTPLTFDLSSLTGDRAEPKQRIVEAILEWVPKMKHEGPRERLSLMAKQMANLSTPQVHRLYCIAVAFRQVIEAAILFLAVGENEASWETLSFVIDSVRPRADNREEQLFSGLICSWLAAWSEVQPFPTITEIHTPDLLIFRKYGEGDEGFNLGRMIHGNMLRWEDSRNSWGIQLADIAASIVSRAVREPDSYECVKPFVKLMRACPFTFMQGPGLLVEDERDNEVMKRYEKLAEAIKRDQEQ